MKPLQIFSFDQAVSDDSAEETDDDCPPPSANENSITGAIDAVTKAIDNLPSDCLKLQISCRRARHNSSPGAQPSDPMASGSHGPAAYSDDPDAEPSHKSRALVSYYSGSSVRSSQMVGDHSSAFYPDSSSNRTQLHEPIKPGYPDSSDSSSYLPDDSSNRYPSGTVRYGNSPAGSEQKLSSLQNLNWSECKITSSPSSQKSQIPSAHVPQQLNNSNHSQVN